MSDGGKGDSPRPFSVSQDQYASNYERIFGKKKTDNKQSEEKIAMRNEYFKYEDEDASDVSY